MKKRKEQTAFYNRFQPSAGPGNNLNIAKLSEDGKQACEGKILLNECELILETFQNNKAPGNDGIPVEFIL